MNKTIMHAIRAQALEESPRECCGLVIQSGRRQRYVPVPNSHESPTEHFRIDAEHWADAEDSGTIIRVIHSHPGDGARAIPSDLDRQQCNQSGVVWGIYAPDCDEYAEITPDAIPLIGRPFILGSHDCWGLVMDWHATQGVTLTDFRVDYPWWESQYPDNLYFDNWEREGFIECDPAPGCMVIMQVESGKWNHAGVITEEDELLHHLYGQPSCVTPYARGYFKDRTMICVRHKNLPQEIQPWRG
ncbi:C40 family peptidase [Citrobacter gillenii]|uniref:C40 family peptidase n=1 Tax=Citrobacter gillenii TaxID=67828 RepID=UPI0022E19641|nr:C40 family peptidase [Citrobacter gillenii]